jgi:thioredoxin reductase (NADPH)
MRAITQAEKFGARIMVARSVKSLDWTKHPYKITLDDGQTLTARSIVLATGAQYNKPRIANLDAFSGRGIYYSATFMEAKLCVGERVMVIGGGNSAGQAAVFLSQNTAGVIMLVRASGVAETMSRYLIQRIELRPRRDGCQTASRWIRTASSTPGEIWRGRNLPFHGLFPAPLHARNQSARSLRRG